MKRFLCIVISAFLVFGTIGCNTSQKEKNKKEKTTSEESTSNVTDFHRDPCKATYDDYINVKTGSSYDDAVKVLGKPNKAVSSSDSITYIWQGEGNKNISLIVKKKKVISKSESAIDPGNQAVTIEQYNKLKEGMTLNEVEDILGKGSMVYEEKTDDYLRNMYAYYNEDGSSIMVNFRDGKLYSMCQNNLDAK